MPIALRCTNETVHMTGGKNMFILGKTTANQSNTENIFLLQCFWANEFLPKTNPQSQPFFPP